MGWLREGKDKRRRERKREKGRDTEEQKGMRKNGKDKKLDDTKDIQER